MNCKVCGNTSLKKSSVSFFRFPKEDTKCKEWAERCDLLELFEKYGTSRFYKSFRICSEHFDPKDIVFDGRKKRLLQFASPKIKTRLHESETNGRKYFSKDDKPKLLNNFCRLCATKDKNLTDIFGWKGKVLNLEMKLKSTPLIINKYDILPIKMCSQCIVKLNECHEFIADCLTAQTTLKIITNLALSNKPLFFEEQDNSCDNEMPPELSNSLNLHSLTKVNDTTNNFPCFPGNEDNYIDRVSDCEEPEEECTDQLINDTNFITEVDLGENGTIENDYSIVVLSNQVLTQPEVQTVHENVIEDTTHYCDVCSDPFCSDDVTHFLTHSAKLDSKTEVINEPFNEVPFERLQLEEKAFEQEGNENACKICDKDLDNFPFLDNNSFLQQLECSCDCFSNLRLFNTSPEPEGELPKTFLGYDLNDSNDFPLLNRITELPKITPESPKNTRQVPDEPFINLQVSEQTPYKQCTQCEKTFRTKHSLRQHMIVHSDRLYNCTECRMSFKRKNSLRNHMRTHKGAGFYICHCCGFIFKQLRDCVIHERKQEMEEKPMCLERQMKDKELGLERELKEQEMYLERELKEQESYLRKQIQQNELFLEREMEEQESCLVREMEDTELCFEREMEETELYLEKEMEEPELYLGRELEQKDLYLVNEMEEQELCLMKNMEEQELHLGGDLEENEMCLMRELEEQELCLMREIEEQELCLMRQMDKQKLSPKRVMKENDLYLETMEEEQELYSETVMAKQELYSERQMEEEELYSGRVTEEQKVYPKRVTEEQELHSESVMEEQEFYTERIVEEQDVYSERVIEEQKVYPERVTEEQELHSESVMEEQEFYTERIVEEQDVYSERVIEEQKVYPERVTEDQEVCSETVMEELEVYSGIEEDLHSEIVIEGQEWYPERVIEDQEVCSEIVIEGQEWYRERVIEEQEVCSEIVIEGQEWYPERVIEEQEVCSGSVIEEQKVYPERVIEDQEVCSGIEEDLYSERVIEEQGMYAERVREEEELYVDGVIEKEDLYSDRVVEEQELYSVRVVDEEEFVWEGEICDGGDVVTSQEISPDFAEFVTELGLWNGEDDKDHPQSPAVVIECNPEFEEVVTSETVPFATF